MWIRSQDKTRLLKVNYVRVNGNCVEAIHGDMLCTLIGEYSTKEKALLVLDKLEEHTNKMETKYITKDVIRTPHYVTFKMPRDEEVSKNGW